MSKISKTEYHIALGLFTLAQKHGEKAMMFEGELHDILGLDGLSYISDAIYSNDRTFEQALELEGIEIEHDKEEKK